MNSRIVAGNNLRHLCFGILLSAGLSLVACVKQDKASRNGKESKPNVLLIVADDQAYGDLSFRGNDKAFTPQLDELKRKGFSANRFYVSPVCAPTRASLLTGRYHQRTGVEGVTRGRENMSLDEETMAEVLKKAGYRNGLFGKWHNGAHFPYHPLGRGFDEFLGFTSGHWSNYFDTTIEQNGKALRTDGYLPDVLTEASMEFIEEATESEEPFFCFLSFPTPHTPLQVPDAYFDKYLSKGLDTFNATIYAMGENLDWNVGRLVQKLEQLGIQNNTLVIYVSDNGPVNHRFNLGLKGKKGQVDEGGVRVPFFMHWPGMIPKGLESDLPLAHIDLLPTLNALLKLEHKAKNPWDGLSFARLFNSDDPGKDKTLENSVRQRSLYELWGGRKRVLRGDVLMVEEELFDLDKDPGQKRSIRSEQEDVYQELKASFAQWEATLPTKKEEASIPIGFADYPRTVLPAHEAVLHPRVEFRKPRKQTGITYHSFYGWAHDWIDFWTKTTAYPSWNLFVQQKGHYKVYLNYALDAKNSGGLLELNVGGQSIEIKNLPAFEHSKFTDYDRLAREQEAPETDWAEWEVGLVYLEEGPTSLVIKAKEILGEKSIELKDVVLEFQPGSGK